MGKSISDSGAEVEPCLYTTVAEWKYHERTRERGWWEALKYELWAYWSALVHVDTSPLWEWAHKNCKCEKCRKKAMPGCSCELCRKT